MRIPTPDLERLTGDELFWARVRRGGTPLVEELGDGTCAVTFLWRGDEAPALAVNRLGEATMERVPGTDVWHATYRLDADHRASYRLGTGEAARGGGARGGPFGGLGPDPLNARRLPGRWGGPEASVFALPLAPAERWPRREGVARGTLVHHDGVRVYLPATDLTGLLPVLVLLDGDMWLGGLGFHHTLDTMIAEGALPAMAVLAPEAADNAARWRDLTADDAYLSYLADDLLGRSRWPITSDPARTVVAGQSLGGLTALYAGLRRPDRFGRVVAQSPSLWWRPGMAHTVPKAPVDGVPWMVEQYAAAKRGPVAVHLDVGSHEGPMVGYSRELRDVLRARGSTVSFNEFTGGHDYACWRVALADALAPLAL
ncbi:alpha/beta hydrolase-fold protein [Nonomuraea sp. NPDC050663]|uniref:alpha/beta hydrolase-fold protein n=1 Tax=Nonomuraea sp. NPDC050663 TaxID=3364370 RepID=UPI00379BF9D1